MIKCSTIAHTNCVVSEGIEGAMACISSSLSNGVHLHFLRKL